MIRLLITYIFILSSCSSNSNVNKNAITLMQDTINFEILAQDFYGGITESKFIVIQDLKSFEELFHLLNKDKSPGLEIPEINFKHETVIALFLGEKNSGGYSITVYKVISSQDKITIDYKITVPDKEEMVTSVMTQPYCIIKISNPLIKDIVFIKVDF